MAAQQPRTRPKEKVAGDEEATSDLNLGEFATVPTLSNSETALLLSAVKEKRMNTKNPLPEGEILTKTEDYLDVFSRFKRKESIAAVEKILEQTNLARFERSQIANLCCEMAEEVKILIPSIANKISDVDLQHALDEISKLRNFVD